MQLDVYVLGKRVGRLAREGNRHVFTYLPDTPQDFFVSLTMPVRAESYSWPELHPVFQMNLPEGYLKDAIRRRFGPVATVDDISLLALTGRRTIGRVQVLPAGATFGQSLADLDLKALLHSPDAKRLFLEYTETGLAEGIAGVMPKTMTSMAGGHDKATVLTEDYVVKTGPHDLSGLAINEHLCLRAARLAKVAAPETSLSEDGEVLAVRRFDREAGQPLGLEDFCVLKGFSPYRKYEGSHEDLAKIIREYVSPMHLATAREQLFRLVVVNHALHNADAHLKNYALLYGGQGDVRLAPAYDILTVPAYPEFHQDIPGLTLYGKKTWRCGKLLVRYAQQWLNIQPAQARELIAQVSEAVSSAMDEVKEHAAAYPQFREVAKRMLLFWDKGIQGIQPDVKIIVENPGLLVGAGLSDEKREKKRPVNPYANDAGGFHHKAR